jgi:hypothetical protein
LPVLENHPGLTSSTHKSTSEDHPAAARLESFLWLTATLIVVGPVRVAGPSVGLDPSWATALNLGHEAEIRYGRELIFTYGPWGFLDTPLTLARPDFVLGLVLSLASVVAVWLLTLTFFQSKLRPRTALLTTSILTLVLSGVSSPSFLLAAVAMVACVDHLRKTPALSTSWCCFAVAALAALLVQIKFSEGVAVTVFALAASLVSPRARSVRTAGFVVTWVMTSLVLWVIAGNSLSDIWSWLRESTAVTAGYTDAMSQEPNPGIASFVWSAMAVLLIISLLALGWRRGSDRRVTSHLASVVVMAGTLFFGFKQSFTRFDPGHNAAFFVIAALLLCALSDRGPRLRATALLIVLAALMAGPVVSTYVRGNPVNSWLLTWRVLTSNTSQAAVLKEARVEDQAAYDLPRAMVEATHGQTVSVDPWEVSMVWAYSMRWQPMPVLQSYTAYTAELDQLNADAARRAGSDHMIIRAMTVTPRGPGSTSTPRYQVTSIDGRNPMWESPRYSLTVICNYSLVTSDKNWMLLRKSANRCRGPYAVTGVQQVSADEQVKVPTSGATQIVTASFFPNRPSPLASLGALIVGDSKPLTASLDGISFRLPDGIASGPLMTVLPSTSGWPVEFRGHTSTRSISFSRPGKVVFHTIDLIEYAGAKA